MNKDVLGHGYAPSCDLVALSCFCIFAVVFVWEVSGVFLNCMYFSKKFQSVFFQSVFSKVYFPHPMCSTHCVLRNGDCNIRIF